MFCSKQCMSIGHRFHQYECDIDIKMDQDSCIFQMCHRVVFEALGIFGKIGKLKAFLEEHSKPTTIFDHVMSCTSSKDDKEKEKNLLLATHFLQRNPIQSQLEEPLEKHCQLMMSITDNKDNKKFLHDFMRHQMGLIITNSFGLIDNSEEIGAGVFPLASYFNHSCAPNVYRITYEGKLIFIVIRPIEKNQQLFVCYRENFFYTDLDARQKEIHQAYKFTCDCEACRNNYATLDKLPRHDAKLKISSSNSLPLDSILTEYEKNCAYINANYQNYPSYETCKLIERNYDLLSFIVCVATSCLNFTADE